MKNWFKSLFYNPTHPGAFDDLRTDEEKSKDYTQEELVRAVSPVKWTKKTSYRTFTPRRQGKAGSCVSHSVAKEFEIRLKNNYGDTKVVSASYPYQKRANTNIPGSSTTDRMKMVNAGCVFEDLMPSQSMTEDQIMNVYKPKYADLLASPFGIKDITCPIDIDTVASTIENTGKGVSCWFHFGDGEWFGRKEVCIATNNLKYGHSVVAVDYTLNELGKKCLVIEDSASEDGFSQRLIPEFFLKTRCFVCRYMVDFKQEDVKKPSYLEGSIVSLQDCLKFEGLFPSNVDSTGKFGPVTRNAVIAFQKKYGIEQTGTVGPITNAKLVSLYN